MQVIPLESSRRRKSEAEVTEEERFYLRSRTGDMSYAVGNTAVYASFDVHNLQIQTTKATVKDLNMCNKTVKLMNGLSKDTKLVYRAIPLPWRVELVVDSAVTPVDPEGPTAIAGRATHDGDG